MQKSLILFLFIVAVYTSLMNEKVTGMPNPRKIAPAVYLYGSLALASDFLGGLPVVIAAMLTVGLWWRTHPTKTTAKAPKETPRFYKPAKIPG
jgi:hypothetical protein